MRASLITLTLSLALPVAASATTYNLVTDFSNASGTNGVYVYGSGTPLSGSPYLASGSGLTVGGATYNFNYLAVTQNSLPSIGQVESPYASVNVGSVDVPNTDLFLHPGANPGEDSILAFIAPTAGTYLVDVTFTHDDTAKAGNGQFVGVYLDGQLLGPATETLLGTSYGSSYTFDQTVYLAASDALEFDVAMDGNYYNDSTGLSGTITTTPEPSSLVLLGSGILGLAGAARRKLRS